MIYIIFDMEWNQPSSSKEKNPALLHGEIIQLGFFVLDEKMNIIGKERLTIKPVCYPTMNQYVSLLTGITQDEADHGLTFKEAFSVMAKHFSEETVLFTWGDDDMPILRENMAFHGISDILLPAHYNLQRIFCSQTNTMQRQIGLKTAAEQLGINTDIQAHDALNDAYITLLVASKLNIPDGILQYSSYSLKSASRSKPHWITTVPLAKYDIKFTGQFDGMAAFCRNIIIPCPVCEDELSFGVLCRHGKSAFITIAVCKHADRFFIRYELKNDLICVSVFKSDKNFEGIYTTRMRHKEKREKYRKLYHNEAQKNNTQKK